MTDSKKIVDFGSYLESLPGNPINPDVPFQDTIRPFPDTINTSDARAHETRKTEKFFRGEEPRQRTRQPREETREIITIRASDIKPKRKEWIWKYWLARGKFELIGGKVGDGKSTLSFEFAAIISRGGKWPDGTQAIAANVIIWTGEDNVEDTIVP
jgi:hypothetical protein